MRGKLEYRKLLEMASLSPFPLLKMNRGNLSTRHKPDETIFTMAVSKFLFQKSCLEAQVPVSGFLLFLKYFY